LALVTNSPKKYAIEVLNYFELQFDYVIGYHDTPQRKPHPAPFNKVINEFGLIHKDTYSLGDRLIDIQASNEAKINSCACYWGTSEKFLLDNSSTSHRFYTIGDAINFFKIK
jgi:phosphoglycolate phosphatase-like HAD superfamily hydrolase